ncbi:MAG: hypothetical protein ABS85_11235 [Sphingobacteriales bacterium SCN 48-20]|jgi:hypothetical protein|nr:MAG: hypothetical protein ABS85_11235 [Sphingobacteriales bacterium SCN 48-20]OJW42621.1 MAG: hypothetical protein BGO56_11195 [Sphingobacteriales bacterium 48-107]
MQPVADNYLLNNMKKHRFLPLILIAALFSCAQSRSTAASQEEKRATMDTLAKPYWEISLGKQTVLKSREENKESNQVVLTKDKLQQSLTIAYYDEDPSLYIRSIMITNAEGNTVFRKESVTQLTISAKEFAALWQNNTTLEIQTFGMPSDPELAARVRLRPRHLCTFVLR